MKKVILSVFILLVIIAGASAQDSPVSVASAQLVVIKADGKVFQSQGNVIVEENAPDAKDKVYINPGWIESIEVFKGKDATDRYGAQGEKGVVVMTLAKDGFHKLREEDKPKFKSIN